MKEAANSRARRLEAWPRGFSMHILNRRTMWLPGQTHYLDLLASMLSVLVNIIVSPGKFQGLLLRTMFLTWS